MPLIFPSGLAYAVIQLNPLAMVRDLGLDDDLETLSAVAEMKPRKYLIYLEYALDLPLPKSRWCRYSMSPIGTTLRPLDRKHELLPDMVVPIFPNTQYSLETRHPVFPKPSFPFSTCFHWIENVTEIRVRRRPNGELFNNPQAVHLEAKEHVALDYTFSAHFDRVRDVAWDEAEDSEPSPSEDVYLGSGLQPAVPPDALLNPSVRVACSPLSPSPRPLPSMSSDGSQVSTLPHLDESSSRRSMAQGPGTRSGSGTDSNSASTLSEKQQAVVEEISDLNLFGWDPDPTFPLLPLVDLWLELEEHLSADDIPSPVDWYKEERQVVSIIMDAFERRNQSARSTVPTTQSPPSSSSTEPVITLLQSDRLPVEIPASDAEVDQRGRQPRVLQKVGSGARWIVGRVARALCLGHG